MQQQNNIIIIILLVILILITGYIAFFKKASVQKNNYNHEQQTQDEQSNTQELKKHVYVNNELGFYIDIPGVKVSDATSVTNGVPDDVKQFFVKDQNDNYVFRISVSDDTTITWHKNPIAKITYNSITFTQYKVTPLGGSSLNYYDVTHNGRIYMIEIRNHVENLDYFGFIN